MRRSLALLTLCWCLVAPLLGLTSAPANARDVTALRVGSFNIGGVHADTSATGNHRPWRERRDAVVSQVLSRKLAVVGLQEANPSTIYKSRLVDRAATTQFADLVAGLNARGGNYAVTTSQSYNCLRSTSSGSCSYRDHGSALSNRIVYDRGQLSVVSKGSMKYAAQTAGKYDRYLEWAVFSVRATGARFLFTNTHLDPYSTTNRERQWREALTRTAQLRGSMPVVSVGDYNTTKFSTWAARMLPLSRQHDLTDMLDSSYRVNPSKRPRAEKIVNGWMNSFNRYNPDVRAWSYHANRTKHGNTIDWIFASRALRVTEFEVVVGYDAKTLRTSGVLPSDHNLLRATILIP